METPILQITVLKGPRNGEIIVCKPESPIKIGRIMKGNSLALRDPAISQNHLCFRFIQVDFRWFVSDLNSSNGTTVNGSRIQASKLVSISDGDVIEIGAKTKLGVKIVTPRILEGKKDDNNVRGRRVTRRGGPVSATVRVNSSRVSGEEIGLKGAQSKVSALVRGRRNNVRPVSTVVSDKEEDEALNPDLVSDSGVEMGQKGTGRRRGDIVTRNTARAFEKEESRDSVMFSHLETEESDHNREAKVRRNPRRVKSSRVLKEVDGNCAVDSVLEIKEVGMKRKGMGGGRSTESTVSEEEKENGDNSVLKLDGPSSDPDRIAIPELRKGIKARTGADSSMVIEEEGEEDAGVEEIGLKGAQSKVSDLVRGRRNNVRPISTMVSDKEEEEALNPDLVSDSGVETGQKETEQGMEVIVTRNTGRDLEKEESRDSVIFSHLETEESDHNREAKVRRNPRRVKSSRVLKEVDGNCAVDSVLEVKEVGMKRKGMGGGRTAASTVSEEEKENGDNLVLKLDGSSSDPDCVAIPELRKGIKARTGADSSMVIEEEGEEDAGVEEIGLKGAQSKVSDPVRGRRNNVRPISTIISDKEEEEALNPDLVSDSGVEMCQKETTKGMENIVTRNTARVLEKEESRDPVMFSHLVIEESDHNGEAKMRRNPRRVKSSKVLKEVDRNCAVDSVLGVKEVGMKRKGMGGGRDTASTVSEEEKENDDNLVLKLDSPSSDPDHVAIPELRKGIKARTSADSSMIIEEEGEEDVGVEEGERNSEEARVDFEKMILDEWFDNMEFFLPTVIREESEKIIGILKEKARKFDELLEVGTDAA